MIVDPRGLDVVTWSSLVTPLIDKYGPIGVLSDPANWQGWASHVMLQIGLDKLTDLPSPYAYADWREWAMRFDLITDTIV